MDKGEGRGEVRTRRGRKGEGGEGGVGGIREK